jgi:DnaK suppressor protein
MLFPTFDKRCLMVEIIEIKVLRQRIIDELTALNHLRTQARDSRAPVKLDQQSVGRLSRIDAMQQQAMNIANDTRRQRRHQTLMAALKRIETSDYGYCLNCDDAIGAGRLAIDPAVTLCVDCA